MTNDDRLEERLRRALAARDAPPLGFEARVMARARATLGRRRRAFILSGVGLAAATVAVLLFLRRDVEKEQPPEPEAVAPGLGPHIDRAAVGGLLELSDLDPARDLRAAWDEALEPLSPIGLLAPDTLEETR